MRFPLNSIIDVTGKLAPSYHIGIDVGSTTVKAVAVDARTHEVAYSTYRRHHADQVRCLTGILRDMNGAIGGAPVRIVLTGSGGKSIADALSAPYVQEVVANSIAVQNLYPIARCAIELGGQDAKMIFFERDPETGSLNVADMRMNGSCAGGTGAFIDEIASLLKIPVEQLNDAASKGSTVYDISGRCGVYAKTDIQPLLNNGAAKEDLALSTYHAIAKQTLGGLAQGLDIHPPVIFEGGPLTFNPRLVDVFAERLNLAPEDIIRPEHPETIVALGAAYSLEAMFAHEGATTTVPALIERIGRIDTAGLSAGERAKPFFENDEERVAFEQRHRLPDAPRGAAAFRPGATVRAYLGIDSGSTTTKFALIDEHENLIDEFYSSNEGEPLDIAQAALARMEQSYREAGVNLQILACGTTGYGENLFAHAYHADAHMVETVAHAVAAEKYEPDATFVLDIGGQDMKAIWLDGGIVTDIVVNEACSSGCGSFLQSFAGSLGMRVEDIAEAAFRSKSPAKLGSRCTVFMTSSVVTEQKNGKTPEDIMAGLCRSIIENVFTKVIRVSNLENLGDHIVVQGGTFLNDAVLAAFEAYVGKPVTRAPYPGLMGAIGAAMLAKQKAEADARDNGSYESTFIGLPAVHGLRYKQTPNVTCPFCTNACSRTLVEFSDGSKYVTGNRCERGLVLGDPKDKAVAAEAKRVRAEQDKVPNLFADRQRLLFRRYPVTELADHHDTTIGLPRVLALWDNAPFWTTFWRALGFNVRLSRLSTRKMYEDGLSAVASDTVCFPAKLVHGHIRDLVRAGVDRIFMPVVTTVSSENKEVTSQSMCAVVKGYPLVIQNADNPEARFGVPFDNPLFHWYTDRDRARQLGEYMRKAYGVPENETLAAIEQADAAQGEYTRRLKTRGAEVLDAVRARGRYAVVLASRPYHNDPLVNHDLPRMFTEMGIPVLTPDAVPGVNEVDLAHSRLDIVNNFHARMLGSAVIAACDANLEYVQVVSFGCGHDAYLTDEIIRLMKEAGGKTPLVLKVDESDAAGPLRIRTRSFIETVNMRRAAEAAAEADTPASHAEGAAPSSHAPAALPEGANPGSRLSDPYPQKFERADRKRRVILIPNTSHAFSRLMAAVFNRQGVTAVAMPIGREEAIRLGKKYVHNDICFPAQIVIGEALAELETGKYEDAEVAIGTGKYIGDCRLTHYAALLRKALDDAGYADVPIITNDDVDFHNMQPGWKMNVISAIRIAMGLPMIDALEELLRKIRPYELEPGAADAAFERAVDALMEGMEAHGTRGAERGFKRAIQIMKEVPYDRSHRKPTVLIVGEYLLNFHPGANHEIERYLEANGFEVIEARMTDVIRKTYFYKDAQVKEYHVDLPRKEAAWYAIANAMFEHAHDVCDRIASAHPLYRRAARMEDIVQASDPIIHHTFDAGEGVLIPAEILHHAEHGCRAFIILQPFGCLPNHIVGRGIAKRLKELYPSAQILPLDYDPDVSFANLENRLQMLVMNARMQEADAEEGAAGEADAESREHTGDGGRTGGNGGAQNGTVIDWNDLAAASEELAACAQAVAAVAQNMAEIANDAKQNIALASSDGMDGFLARAEVGIERARALSAKADQVAARIEWALQGIRSNPAPARAARLSKLERLAASANEMAQQVRADAAACTAQAANRWELARSIAQQRANDKASQLFEEASQQVNEVSVRASQIKAGAEQVASQAAVTAQKLPARL